ncbi:MAG: SDR family NAD(P)-dependent oxidoreductase [Candidatus Hydrogenedentota bacterium]|nr:MAG: SDR family NAD(P)-dependent oxidoreductase [Candidatus Hydrogenedentota bacterium]
MKTFRGKTAVITGAASGIGRALAHELAKKGSNLALSDIDEVGLTKVEQELKKFPVKVEIDKLDVANREDFEKYANKVVDNFGQVDMVFNNAGVALSGRFEDLSLEDFHWLMDINFWGVVYGSKFFIPHLKKRPEAALVNVSSVFGMIGVATQSAYNAAKFAVRGLNESLRAEYAGTNLMIHSVHPGGVRTNIVRNAKFQSAWEEDLDHNTAVELFDKIARTTAEEAAKIILNGVAKKQYRILVGPDAIVIDAVSRLLPENYTGLLEWLTKVVAK